MRLAREVRFGASTLAFAFGCQALLGVNGCSGTTAPPFAVRSSDAGTSGSSTEAQAGAGAQATGGSAGSGGNAGSSGGSGGSGCGKDPGQPLGEWMQYMVPLDGETLGVPQLSHESREIFVRLPVDYDPATSYRVVYIGVGCGAPDGKGSAYPLWDAAQGGDPNAIYVALSLPDPSINNNCYDNRAGVDSIEWESFDHDHTFVASRFCVDDARVYFGGYSSGGWLANMYSCYFGGIPEPPRKFLPNVALRGAMTVSACWIDGNPQCNGPVAALFIHDQDDPSVNTLACAHEQRDRVLLQNSCTAGSAGPTEPWGEDFITDDVSCLKYTACPAEYPVVFCTTVGRHKGASNDIAIAGFARFVGEIEAAAP